MTGNPVVVIYLYTESRWVVQIDTKITRITFRELSLRNKMQQRTGEPLIVEWKGSVLQ